MGIYMGYIWIYIILGNTHSHPSNILGCFQMSWESPQIIIQGIKAGNLALKQLCIFGISHSQTSPYIYIYIYYIHICIYIDIANGSSHKPTYISINQLIHQSVNQSIGHQCSTAYPLVNQRNDGKSPSLLNHIQQLFVCLPEGIPINQIKSSQIKSNQINLPIHLP